jgi:hypothetical protein
MVRNICADIHLVAKVNKNLDNHVDPSVVVFSYAMGLHKWVDANEIGFIMIDQCFQFVSQFSHDWIAALIELHEFAPMDAGSPQKEPAFQIFTWDIVMKPQSPDASSQFIAVIFEGYDEDTTSLKYVLSYQISPCGKRHILSIAQGCLANTAIAE